VRRLSKLVESGALMSIDAELGGLLTRRAASRLGEVEDARLVGLAGAMLSAERARGHSCLDLDTLVGAAMPHTDVIGRMLPNVDGWLSLLARSGMCGDGTTTTSPLVIDSGRLYLSRYHAAECRLASAMRSRFAAREQTSPDAATIALFRTLFPPAEGGATDWQAVAAAAAMRGGLTVITGGPGTGKTTAVARILALLLQRTPDLRVALAAPTGKAAARLAESVLAGVRGLPIGVELAARIPAEGRTLHRLLGYRPWNDEFAHGADEPLAEDVVIVDEASMVDVLMMDALFAALRPTARIILLGDQDQLASVDTGFVLGDVCRAADRCSAVHGVALGAWVEQLSGLSIETAANVAPLRDAVVRLSRSYRFASQPGIGALSEAIRRGDANGATTLLADAHYDDVTLRDAATTAALLEPVSALFDEYLAASDPAQALERFSAFRLLCAVRDGRRGVSGLNERVEDWLRREHSVPTRAKWYDRRPVLVTANDPATGLYNGDVGVTVIRDGVARVWFRDGSGAPRAVSPARLPAHETAWAMTVHKAQGSEFAHVLFVLPEDDVQVLTRELLYTAVTRARVRVDIVGSSELLARAIGRTTLRASGLADRLLA